MTDTTLPATTKAAAGLAQHETQPATAAEAERADGATSEPETPKRKAEPRPYVVLEVTARPSTDTLVAAEFEVVAEVTAHSTRGAIEQVPGFSPDGEHTYVAVTARSFQLATPKAKVRQSVAW